MIVVIYVQGGVVADVSCSGPEDIQVILCDKDNEQAGDPEAVWYPVNHNLDGDELQRLYDVANS